MRLAIDLRRITLRVVDTRNLPDVEVFHTAYITNLDANEAEWV